MDKILHSFLDMFFNYPLIWYGLLGIIAFFSVYFLLTRLDTKKDTTIDGQFRLKFSATIAIAIVSLILAYTQLVQIRQEINSNTYNQMNAWYNELYKEFPKIFKNKDIEEEKRNLARRYFNLWQSELNHCTNRSINDDFMNVINHGACKNILLYPELREQYIYWNKENAFYHDPDLRHQISIILDYANRNECEKIPNTRGCLIK